VNKIKHPEQLRKLYSEPKSRALGKVRTHIDSHAARFVELSPFFILGTVDRNGRPDLSPPGGTPGFVRVLDPGTLEFQDRPGNNRLDSLANLICRPAVAMLFVVPGIDETWRAYGEAELFESLSGAVGERPVIVVSVKIQRAYFQCAKALMRARLWASESRIDRNLFPSLGEILNKQMGMEGPAESQDNMVRRYLKDL